MYCVGDPRATSTICLNMVYVLIAGVRLNEPPSSVLNHTSIGWVDPKSHSTRLVHIHPYYGHRHELAISKSDCGVLCVTSHLRISFYDVVVVVPPVVIGHLIQVEIAVVIGFLTQSDLIGSSWSIEITLEHQNVVGRIRRNCLAWELDITSPISVKVNVARINPKGIHTRSRFIVERSGIRPLALIGISRVLETKVLHARGRLDYCHCDLTVGTCVCGCGYGSCSCVRCCSCRRWLNDFDHCLPVWQR